MLQGKVAITIHAVRTATSSPGNGPNANAAIATNATLVAGTQEASTGTATAGQASTTIPATSKTSDPASKPKIILAPGETLPTHDLQLQFEEYAQGFSSCGLAANDVWSRYRGCGVEGRNWKSSSLQGA